MDSSDESPSKNAPLAAATHERRPGSGEVPDDAALDAAIATLLGALEADDLGVVASTWPAFARDVVAHMDDEEQRVTPRIAAVRPREALAILQEHRFLRGRLRELGDALARRALRLEDARSFRDELRAHARHEEKILQRMPEANDGSSE
jgi:hypothetical protein